MVSHHDHEEAREMQVLIGVDPHKRSHHAVAIDKSRRADANARDVAWTSRPSISAERLVAPDARAKCPSHFE